VSCAAYLECTAFGSYTKENGSSPSGQGMLETFSG